jgi:hypothetical protein
MADSAPPRRRFQFSMRTMFYYVFIVASLCVLARGCYEGYEFITELRQHE